MAIDSSTKFGIVYSTPSDFISKIGSQTNTAGKLYVLHGAANGGITQGIYMVEENSSDPDGSTNVQMLSSGALASANNAGLMSQILFNKLNNVDFGDYLLANNYVQCSSTADGYVPKVDGSDGTIDSQTTDWVLAYDGSKVGWFKLPANAFNNTTYTGSGAISLSGTTFSHTNSGATAGRYGDNGSTRTLEFGETFKVVDASVNAYGHVTAISTKTLTLPTKPDTAGTADSANKVAQTFDVSFNGADILTYNGSSNKTLAFKKGANIDITNSGGTLTIATTGVPTTTQMNDAINSALTSVLKYKNTVDGSNSKLPTTHSKGDVYVASTAFTTTAAQTGVAYNVESGDYFISNGSTFDVINGENQVEQLEHTLSWGTDVSVAKIDGTTIKVKLPTNPNTDTKVTEVGNHYTPSTNSASKITRTASSTTAATWGSTDMITGITLQRDAAGHVTDVSISSIQMPTNPNTDTKVTDEASTSKAFILGHATQGTNATALTNSSCYMSGGYLYSGGAKVLTSATDTKCTLLTLHLDSSVDVPSTLYADVISNTKISASGSGESLTGTMTSVRVATQVAVDAAQEAATVYWETL